MKALLLTVIFAYSVGTAMSSIKEGLDKDQSLLKNHYAQIEAQTSD